ncbi:hypothetical protein AMTR_s00125p00026450 [Amborella trichopoda]|uniref:Uncharacterized protein n=1 Tax=Amborella trichopoda TaxID=13333 RepID=W1NRW2_AMBTC|nr:hypothetical protein AMTR_s00125p00026450 [Amborella trichopoda]
MLKLDEFHKLACMHYNLNLRRRLLRSEKMDYNAINLDYIFQANPAYEWLVKQEEPPINRKILEALRMIQMTSQKRGKVTQQEAEEAKMVGALVERGKGRAEMLGSKPNLLGDRAKMVANRAKVVVSNRARVAMSMKVGQALVTLGCKPPTCIPKT